MNRLEAIVEDHYSRMYDNYNKQNNNVFNEKLTNENEELEEKFEHVLQKEFTAEEINRLNDLYDGRRFGESENDTRVK